MLQGQKNLFFNLSLRKSWIILNFCSWKNNSLDRAKSNIVSLSLAHSCHYHIVSILQIRFKPQNVFCQKLCRNLQELSFSSSIHLNRFCSSPRYLQHWSKWWRFLSLIYLNFIWKSMISYRSWDCSWSK